MTVIMSISIGSITSNCFLLPAELCAVYTRVCIYSAEYSFIYSLNSWLNMDITENNDSLQFSESNIDSVTALNDSGKDFKRMI